MDKQILHRFLYDILLARTFEERAAQFYPAYDLLVKKRLRPA